VQQAFGFTHFIVWADDRWNTPAHTIERYLQSHSSKCSKWQIQICTVCAETNMLDISSANGYRRSLPYF